MLGKINTTMKFLSDILNGSVTSSLKLEELKVEAARMELLTSIAEREAKVAQEQAIAAKIESASEVIIEEVYENKGEARISGDVSKSDFGVSGSSQRISRKIYTFKGLVRLS